MIVDKTRGCQGWNGVCYGTCVWRLVGRRLGELVFRLFSSHVEEGIIFRNIDFPTPNVSICSTAQNAATNSVQSSESDKLKWTQKMADLSSGAN